MKILVTGANGFVGKNLIAELNNRGYSEIFKVVRETTKEELNKYTKHCGFIFHLAGVNRPKDDKEFMEGNFGFTSELLELLKKNNNKSPIVITSSTQAEKGNPYGNSKKAGEDLLIDYENETGIKTYIFRLPNLFGKWSKPYYNSVVSTFCHNIARDMEIQINNSDTELELAYIDDVIKEFINIIEGNTLRIDNFCMIPITYKVKLGRLAKIIKSFRDSREHHYIPNMGDDFTKKLYSTYLSYLPEDKFSYPLKMNIDERGSFTEFIKSPERGQVSVNISKPGITKGNHWHHSKNEKFLVVSGEGVIRFRKIDEEEIIEYKVSGEKLEVLDIPTGYTHNIENLGNTDMVTIMWANETFDPENPDTYYLEV